MIVMAIIGVLATLAIPSFVGALRQATRSRAQGRPARSAPAIDSYTMDKQKAPQALDDLITDGYLKEIPQGPHDPE